MASWLDSLEQHGKRAVREGRKRKVAAAPEQPPVVHKVQVTVRQPVSANDPGEVTIGFYVLTGNGLTITDKDGHSIDGGKVVGLIDGADDPRSIARAEIRRHWEKNNDGFNRPIGYPALGVV